MSTKDIHSIKDLHVYETDKKKAFNERYEIVQKIGKGSMGDVCLVVKREEAIGGSALKENQMYKLGGLYFKKNLFNPFAGHKHRERSNSPKGGTRTSSNKNNNTSFRRSEGGMRGSTGSSIPDSERRRSEVVYALKSIQLNLIGDRTMIKELRNEIEIMKAMDHPNIAKAYEIYYHGDSNIYVVMECCSGGDLYARSPYPEGSAARYGKEILRAIAYMHQHGIVHRDLKFENIMFESNHEAASVKLIDFGLAKKFSPGQNHEKTIMTNFCGSLYTMAPQVIMQIYTAKADLWSYGVILYMLLSCKKPFQKKKRKDLIKQIVHGDYFDMDGNCKKQSYNEAWEHISDDAKDLVRKLLVVDQDERLSASDALKHPWFSSLQQNPNPEKPDGGVSDGPPKPNPYAIRAVSEGTHQKVEDSLLQYKNTSKLKRIALNIIAYNSSSDEIMKLRRVFKEYDTMHNGVITFDEFKEAMGRTKLSESLVTEMFESIDVNENGHIMYTEFLAATLEAHGQIEEERIAEAFDRLDSDNTGYISQSQLADALGKDKYSKEEIKEIMREVDANNDGKISYDEFLKLFRKQTSKNMMQVGDDDDLTNSN